jgi:putative MATE family efflux protein
MARTTISPPLTPGLTAPSLPARTQLLLEAPILPTLLRLAAPNVVVVLVQVVSSTLDAFFVGRLGADALAGVSLAFPVWILMVTMSAGGIGVGVASAIARALGAGRRSDANALVSHALAIALAMSLVFTAGVLSGGPALYRAMGGTGDALAAALAYSNVVFGGAVLVWLVNTFASIARGAGDMLRPALIVVAGEVVHLALAPILIFGLGPVPPLGVAGAGISLITSFALRALALAIYLRSGSSLVTLSLRVRGLRPSFLWEILRVGLPGSINTILTSLNVMAVTGLVGTFGTLALAGYGMAVRLEYLLIPLVFGLGTTLVTMVGANVGAGQIARARRVAWSGAGLAAVVTGGVGLVVALAPGSWLGLFSAEPEVLAAGEAYFRVVGPTYGLFGLGLAFYFASQGAGRVGWPLVGGFARFLVAVGGGWAAMSWLGGGLDGLFVAIALGFALFGGLLAAAVNASIRPR